MQRRYTLIAAVALVALVLVPGAALAAGFQHGSGQKVSPLGQKHGAPDWAGNATALRANQSAGAGDGVCDGACLMNRTCDQNRTQLRTCTNQAGQVCCGDQVRDRLQSQVRARDRVVTTDAGPQSPQQGRHRRGATV